MREDARWQLVAAAVVAVAGADVVLWACSGKAPRLATVRAFVLASAVVCMAGATGAAPADVRAYSDRRAPRWGHLSRVD